MNISGPNVMKRSRISDYSMKRAPVINNDEETSNPKEIILPSRTSSVTCKKNRKAKSLNFQRENSARGLRSTLRREKHVSKGLGLGIHRESSVSRGLGFSNRTARLMVEARKEEVQCDYPKRPRMKRQRGRRWDSTYGAPPRSDLKVVYNVATQKNNLVSDGKALSPIKRSRRPSVIFRRSPSFDVKEESPRTAISPNSVVDDISLSDDLSLSPTSSEATMSPEDRSKLRVPIKSSHNRIVFPSDFHIECGSSSKPKEHRFETPALRGKSIGELMAKLDMLSL
jgi:hypothetical protein